MKSKSHPSIYLPLPWWVMVMAPHWCWLFIVTVLELNSEFEYFVRVWSWRCFSNEAGEPRVAALRQADNILFFSEHAASSILLTTWQHFYLGSVHFANWESLHWTDRWHWVVAWLCCGYKGSEVQVRVDEVKDILLPDAPVEDNLGDCHCFLSKLRLVQERGLS